MIRKLFVLLSLIFLYQVISVSLLYNSNYLNVVSYYTHPPIKGAIELKRLPFLFGDQISLKILKSKKAEAAQLINAGNIGMAAILSSYQHNQALPKADARKRSIQVAELFISAGYDLSQCESDGRSTASVLRDWGVLDEDFKVLLSQAVNNGDIFSCQ
ncbi:hypothetical protein [Microbulbifer sp. VAAF005]|uniref:hypothetical protein n=1 Tax=Microbulbifer sp. VAAF005 TaxID=3034230 RepID=UPI0024ADBEE5|nr:hypothetical protein [Microbulbifer sp. VAAF005]WHI47321.1 hypothetical protein P0078_02775 [Microbulbifer sp. VAAF005]